MRWALLLALAASSALHAQKAAAVFLGSPTSQLLAADTVQVTATAYDSNGNLIPTAKFTWRVSDSSAVSVDTNGVVTAKTVGWSDIFADTTGATGTIRLQIVPLAINVKPANQTIHVGDSLQYTADVLDKNSQPMQGVALLWRAYGANSGNNTGITVTSGGMVNATGFGPFFVEAYFNYTVGSGPFIPRFFGNTLLTVTQATPFSQTKLFDSGAVRQSFQLRERRGLMSVNDQGQVAYVGWLEGFATAALLWTQGSFKPIAAASVPSGLTGFNVLDFDDMALNNNGEVSTRCLLAPYRGCMLFGAKDGTPNLLLFDGSAGTGVTNVRNFATTRFGLNDSSLTLFRADYLPLGSSPQVTGLFTVSPDGEITLVVPAATALPGLGTTYTFDRDFGIANDGTLLFFATNGSTRALYRMTPDYTIARVVGTGDMVDGAAVTSLSNVAVGKNGQYATSINNGTTVVLRFAGDPSQRTDVTVNYVNTMLAVGSQGDVLFTGAYNGSPNGLFRMSGGVVRAVALTDSPSPTGDIYTQFDSAGITASGQVYLQARTANNLLMVVNAGGIRRPKPVVLFQTADMVNVSAGPAFASFVLNSHTGNPMIKTGSYTTDVLEASAAVLLPRLVNGDRLPGGWFYEGNDDVRRNANGDLFVCTDQAVSQISASGTALLAHFPVHGGGGNLYACYQVVANTSGMVVGVGGTSFGGAHLSVFANGTVTPIAYLGANPPYRTNSPGGGYFQSSNDIAVDEAGKVYGYLHVTGGPDGLFVYSNGVWSSLLKIGDTFDGRAITSFSTIRAAGNAFYATIQVSGSLWRLARYQGGTWTDLVSYGDTLASGGVVNGVGTFDVNRNGVAAVNVSGSGVQYILYIDGNQQRVVVDNDHVIPSSGELLANLIQVSINDDKRVFVIAINNQDQMVLYEFDPQF